MASYAKHSVHTHSPKKGTLPKLVLLGLLCGAPLTLTAQPGTAAAAPTEEAPAPHTAPAQETGQQSVPAGDSQALSTEASEQGHSPTHSPESNPVPQTLPQGITEDEDTRQTLAELHAMEAALDKHQGAAHEPTTEGASEEHAEASRSGSPESPSEGPPPPHSEATGHDNLTAKQIPEDEAHQPPLHQEEPHATDAAHGAAHGEASHDAPAHGNTTQEAGTHGEAAHDKASDGETPHEAGEEAANPYEKEEFANLIHFAEKASAEGRIENALIAYQQALKLKMTRQEARSTLLGFARTLKKKGDLTKTIAIFERVIKDYPAEADTPEIYLELGRCQRALGAYKTAIARFYSVINSTIKLPQDGAGRYRLLAKTAQFEIAETYFMAADYKEAQRFYSRLRLLDLNPVDQARAHFKASYAQYLGGDLIGAITQLRSFMELHPEDENVPEAHYIIAMALRKLNRSQEALYEALQLLKAEKKRTAQDPKRWAYWQRKTGNQIANEFYLQGDIPNALSLYLTLAELSDDPVWRTPLLYQIALCQERQGRTDRAIGNYKAIIAAAAERKTEDPRKAQFDELAKMAQWRLGQIDWIHNAEKRLNTVLPPSEDPASQAPAGQP